jgi:hypothetical protein
VRPVGNPGAESIRRRTPLVDALSTKLDVAVEVRFTS